MLCRVMLLNGPEPSPPPPPPPRGVTVSPSASNSGTVGNASTGVIAILNVARIVVLAAGCFAGRGGRPPVTGVVVLAPGVGFPGVAGAVTTFTGWSAGGEAPDRAVARRDAFSSIICSAHQCLIQPVGLLHGIFHYY